jgi:hypothetical protein
VITPINVPGVVQQKTQITTHDGRGMQRANQPTLVVICTYIWYGMEVDELLLLMEKKGEERGKK